MKPTCAFTLLLVLAVWLRPASANIDVDGDMIVVRSAAPGETYEGDIVIRNNGDEPEEIKVYQTDYSFQCNGSNSYGEPGKLPRSNAVWISLRRNNRSSRPDKKSRCIMLLPFRWPIP